MKIKILGNGGAINDGLPYNAFVINGTLLCETPPDIMLSINKNFVELSSINTIYISHLHGDHIFGLPFLIISAFFLHVGNDKKLSFIIVGPVHLKASLL
jgi:ribonuclease BN (tRNA processing enzyme)